MTSQPTQETTSLQIQQIINQVINSWKAQNKTAGTVFNKHEDEAYFNEVAPGRNRGIYLMGHLIAASDGMLPLLGISDRLFPELEALFSSNPDGSFEELPTVAELKYQWDIVTNTLTEHFSKMQPHEWLERHTKVSAEDFALDPLRNKLNILISRTTHQSYHLGQMAFLAQRELAG